MTDQLASLVAALLAKAPEWIRHDFAAKDQNTRRRAEEALAAMIAAAVAESKASPE